MKKKAVFAGTFDPYTLGHHSIVMRALAMFDTIVIAIGTNATKSTRFSIKERIDSIRQIYLNEPHVEVTTYEGLTVDFAKKQKACCLLRGIRSVKDFEYERELADLNRNISGIETVILISEPQYSAISSSAVRELMNYGKDVSRFLP